MDRVVGDVAGSQRWGGVGERGDKEEGRKGKALGAPFARAGLLAGEQTSTVLFEVGLAEVRGDSLSLSEPLHKWRPPRACSNLLVP